MVYDCASSISFSLRHFSVDSASWQQLKEQRPPVSALTPHESRRYQGISSEILSSKAD